MKNLTGIYPYEKFSEEVLKIRDGAPDEPLLISTGGDFIEFTEAAFPGVPTSQLAARFTRRSPNGSGAHFDVYEQFLSPDFPWLGVFNLSGHAALKAATLPAELNRDYRERFPEPTDAAHRARRHYSQIALDGGEDIYTYQLIDRTGIVIPQLKGNLPVVHEVSPVEASRPGAFIKVAVLDDVVEEAYKATEMLSFDSVVSCLIDDVLTDGSTASFLANTGNTTFSEADIFARETAGYESSFGGKLD